MSDGMREKAEALAAVYQYVASRLESVDQRSSVLMVLCGSFVSFLAMGKPGGGDGVEALLSLLARPSMIAGVAAFMCFYLSQSVRIKQQDDLISQIVFSERDIHELIGRFNSSSPERLLCEIILNQRLIGRILARKGKFYNSGAALFCFAAFLRAVQL